MSDPSQQPCSTERNDLTLQHARLALKLLEQAGFQAKFAGGCVRDRLLGLQPKDFDIATTARPEETMTTFAANGFKAIPTGLEYGTITVVVRGTPLEITTLRKDVQTFGRHAEVEFGTSFLEDASRRDFTINAMFEGRDGHVSDHFGGQADLRAGILRFVGDPKARVKEDRLRILRLYRFWAQLGFRPEAEALAAARKDTPHLDQVSQERKSQEWIKILAHPKHSWQVFLELCKDQVFDSIWPQKTCLDAQGESPDKTVNRQDHCDRHCDLLIQALSTRVQDSSPAETAWHALIDLTQERAQDHHGKENCQENWFTGYLPAALALVFIWVEGPDVWHETVDLKKALRHWARMLKLSTSVQKSCLALLYGYRQLKRWQLKLDPAPEKADLLALFDTCEALESRDQPRLFSSTGEKAEKSEKSEPTTSIPALWLALSLPTQFQAEAKEQPTQAAPISWALSPWTTRELSETLRQVGHLRRHPSARIDGKALLERFEFHSRADIGRAQKAWRRGFYNQLWVDPEEGLQWLEGQFNLPARKSPR